MSSVKKLQAALLNWYDTHQRVLPWRTRAGQRPDPYHVWLSEIMLQQTTVATVGSYFVKFIGLWPRVQDLARADLDDVLTAWAGLGYYARARNLHKCARVVVEDYNGQFPDDVAALQKLPGIGPYTAAAVASIAFDKEATAVDGNVERVVSRMYGITNPLPDSKPDIRLKASGLTKDNVRPGDFTQAMMELGATVCTPKKPKCGLCPWQGSCRAYKDGNAESLPAKRPKAEKPTRYGVAFWYYTPKGAFFIRKRPETGLLGGMYEIPSTEWIGKKPARKMQVQSMPYPAEGVSLSGTVRHTFTHFHLVLEIKVIKVAKQRDITGGVWIIPDRIEDFALPTVMKKIVRLAAPATVAGK